MPSVPTPVIVARIFGAFAIAADKKLIVRDFRNHPRDWRGFRYVYPVMSRRSRGLSIGVNLNPDTACNFDCIYCQVDRTTPPKVREVNLDVLRAELDAMLSLAMSGDLFNEPEFAATTPELQRLNDIAFSGDGEPTTCPLFAESVQLAADLIAAHGASVTRLILITDACYLTRPNVIAGLEIMDRSNGKIWAKLDAGTEEYYRLVNRPNYPLTHVIENIIHAARIRPVTIQSLFMRVNADGPSADEINAYCDRLNEIRQAGAMLDLVQVYTVARRPAESYVSPLSQDDVDAITTRVTHRTQLPVEPYYG